MALAPPRYYPAGGSPIGGDTTIVLQVSFSSTRQGAQCLLQSEPSPACNAKSYFGSNCCMTVSQLTRVRTWVLAAASERELDIGTNAVETVLLLQCVDLRIRSAVQCPLASATGMFFVMILEARYRETTIPAASVQFERPCESSFSFCIHTHAPATCYGKRRRRLIAS